jgi:hypothetical protein
MSSSLPDTSDIGDGPCFLKKHATLIDIESSNKPH